MSDSRLLRRFDLFTSAKTACAIRARHPALHEALVQATLDPSVRSIGYQAKAIVGAAEVTIDAVIIQQDSAGICSTSSPRASCATWRRRVSSAWRCATSACR
ncbi:MULTISPECIES: hypothetical protein [Bradyrhizobium]|uniref:hypothetical protein n=1 Tax=Bradyrhizobium TaxID=374 RepID=UPI001FED5402|nr:hypothetical protein [Bradyrhizobium diazoefficiens]